MRLLFMIETIPALRVWSINVVPEIAAPNKWSAFETPCSPVVLWARSPVLWVVLT